MRLWYPKDPENASALKILATANFLDLQLETEPLDGAKSGWTNTSEDFKEHYDPTGQYPVLELADPEILTGGAAMNNNNNNNSSSPRPSGGDATGRSSASLQTARRRPSNLLLNGEASKSNHIFGANAILRFVGRSAGDETKRIVSEFSNKAEVAEKGSPREEEAIDFFNHQDEKYIYGRTPFEASQVDMWIAFSENELDAANRAFIHAHFAQKDKGGLNVPNSAEEFKKVERVLAALDEVLLIRTFLVGERMTLADIAVAFSVQLAYRCNKKYSEELAKRFRQVYRHYNSVMRHPKIKEVMRQAGATLGPLR